MAHVINIKKFENDCPRHLVLGQYIALHPSVINIIMRIVVNNAIHHQPDDLGEKQRPQCCPVWISICAEYHALRVWGEVYKQMAV